MNSSKFLKRAASLAMALLLLMSVMPFQALATEILAQDSRAGRKGVSVPIEVEVQLAGKDRLVAAAEEPAVFRFVLEPDDPDNPVPETCEVSIEGDGTVSFGEIVFTAPGIYRYTIWQREGNDEDYTFDTAIYHVTISVIREDDNLLHATIAIYREGQDEKSDGIVFYNEYIEEEEPEEPEETPSPTPSEEVTPTPTPSEEVTPTPTPSEEVTPTPTPSEEVTPSPSPSEEVTPSPTPSEEVTPTPSEEVTPTPTPSEEVTPEPSEEPEEPPTPVPEEPTTPVPVVMEELPDPNDPDSPEYVTIFEDGVPLTYRLVEDPETGEMVYVLIEDEDVPVGAAEAPTGGASPKTGDETNNARWIALLCAVAVGLAGCVWYLIAPKRRNKGR